MYHRVDHLFVHSEYDIQIAKQLYNLPEQRFSYRPFVRDTPATGEPRDIYSMIEDHSF